MQAHRPYLKVKLDLRIPKLPKHAKEFRQFESSFISIVRCTNRQLIELLYGRPVDLSSRVKREPESDSRNPFTTKQAGRQGRQGETRKARTITGTVIIITNTISHSASDRCRRERREDKKVRRA